MRTKYTTTKVKAFIRTMRAVIDAERTSDVEIFTDKVATSRAMTVPVTTTSRQMSVGFSRAAEPIAATSTTPSNVNNENRSMAMASYL